MRTIFFTFFFLSATFAKKLPDIYWNTTNPMMEVFAESNDRVDIRCAQFKQGELNTESSIIYRVSQEDFLTCTLTGKVEEVGRCTSPHQRSTLSVAFRSFSPNPFALEYRPDRTYYFISTSDGTPEGVNNKIGGLCSSNGMKMMVHIREKNAPHPHRHHHKKTVTTSTSTTEAPRPSALPKYGAAVPEHESPLWGHYYEKIAHDEAMWPRRDIVRGERLSLDMPADFNRLEAYDRDSLTAVLDDQMQFQIHEIGEVPDFLPFSSSSSTSTMPLATGLFLLLIVLGNLPW